MNTAKDFIVGLWVISACLWSGITGSWKYLVGGGAIVWLVVVVPTQVGEHIRQINLDPEYSDKGYRTTDTMDMLGWYDWSNGALAIIPAIAGICALAISIRLIFYLIALIARLGKEHRSGRAKTDLCDHQ